MDQLSLPDLGVDELVDRGLGEGAAPGVEVAPRDLLRDNTVSGPRSRPGKHRGRNGCLPATSAATRHSATLHRPSELSYDAWPVLNRPGELSYEVRDRSR